MAYIPLEERLGHLEVLRDELADMLLDTERIDFSKRRNWDRLPVESGGREDINRSWKYAWTHRLAQYFEKKGAPLSEGFDETLYNRMVKNTVKPPVYGIITFKDMPSEIYRGLTDWEKIVFAAGAYHFTFNPDYQTPEAQEQIRTLSLPSIVRLVIKDGYEYLYSKHFCETGSTQTLKIPGSQNYRGVNLANELTKARSNPDSVFRETRLEFEEINGVYEREPTPENLTIITGFLGSLGVGETEYIRERYGTDHLSGFGIE